jgi:predicted enzyme related to lactoylglutathione lyase
MTEFTTYKPGTFSWIDLSTTDPEAAKAFYGGLLGWEFVDIPVGPEMVYTMCFKNGKNVAGLARLQAELEAMNVPPHWSSYVSVADVAASAQKAAELGGTVLVGPMQVMDQGHMAMIQDPTGAVVGMWQPGLHIGSQICNEPGSLTWNELQTRDTAKAAAFYTGLFGWGAQNTDMGGFNYTTFAVGERMNAGMMAIQPEWGEMPANWAVYLAVENCDASVTQVLALGGRVIMPPSDIPNTWRFAVVQDPQGAVFCVMQLENPD